MLKKDNRTKILNIFLEDPLEQFQLREISRKTKLAPKSVKNYLKELEKENIIKKIIYKNYPVYKANRENEQFILLKRLNNIKEIEESGILKYLEDKCIPDTIILFGSFSKGEDIKNSDIDLFLQAKEQTINLAKYESKIHRKISLFFSENFNKLSKELKNNIANGIILKGYLKIV